MVGIITHKQDGILNLKTEVINNGDFEIYNGRTMGR